MHLILPAASALISVVFFLGLVGWATRNVGDPDRAWGWAAASGVRVTDHNRALVRWYSQLSATLRVIGAASGFLLGQLFDLAFGLDTATGPGFWVWLAIGWVVGGFWAYIAVARELEGHAPPVASLIPRRAADYAPRAGRWGPAVAATITVGLALAGLALDLPADPMDHVASSTDLALLAGGSVVLALIANVMIGRVVDRRQPAVHPDQIAADDAMRATTIHLLGAGATAAILLLATEAAEGVLGPRPLPFGLRGWVPVALVVTAVVFARFVPYRPWRVQRGTAAS